MPNTERSKYAAFKLDFELDYDRKPTAAEAWQACAKSKQAEIGKLTSDLEDANAIGMGQVANDIIAMQKEEIDKIRAELAEYQNMKPVAWLSKTGHWTVSRENAVRWEERYGKVMQELFAPPPKEKPTSLPAITSHLDTNG